MIPTLSAKKSASSIKWVVRMMILSFLYRDKRFQMSLLADVSMPEVGSSKIMTFDPPEKAIAIESLLF